MQTAGCCVWVGSKCSASLTHSLVIVVAVAVALVTRVSARAGARAVLLFELGINALAL